MGIGKKRDRQPSKIVRRVPETPRQPIPDSPFPENKGFRLGQYTVVEEHDDYLLCEGYNPNGKDPVGEFNASVFRTQIKVAKPPALQRGAWDGQTITVGDVDYTYEYSDDEFGVRWATWNDDNGKPQAEEQRNRQRILMEAQGSWGVVAREQRLETRRVAQHEIAALVRRGAARERGVDRLAGRSDEAGIDLLSAVHLHVCPQTFALLIP